MHKKVPSYSQFADIGRATWKHRSCGIVCLKMLIDYHGARDPHTKKSPTTAQLLAEGIRTGAYIKNIGWKHAGLATLAAHYGLRGKNYDWAPLPKRAAEQRFRIALMRGPLIASVHRGLDIQNGGHLVVVTDLKDKTIFYNDPDARIRRGVRRSAPTVRFFAAWKQRIVAVHSQRQGVEKKRSV